MANGHGGTRTGAGRKKKALSEKLVDGNPGKAPLTKLQFDVQHASFSKTAKETVQDKLKKLILANAKLPENEQPPRS